MGKERFAGCWKLVSHEFKAEDGKVFRPYGENAVGWVMFDEQGRFSAQIMRPDRPDFTADSAGLEDVKVAFGGYVAYFGNYEINEKDGILVNRVKGSLVPSWVGGEQVRYFEFSDDRVILRTPPIKRGDLEVTGTFVWVRA